jgi:aspartyl-tRNA(Asn)/glutamyl-tRNA(Gln) amidotransferase subunit A
MLATIQAAAAALRQGQVTPLELLEQCLQQIDTYESHIHAWVLIDRAGARVEAERLARELESGQDRGPLHGIPIAIKDIVDVFDWPTAAGSKLWANSIAREDATLVKKLRHAGAVFIGKTVTTQYASFDPPPTRNPWNLARTPGGSSSGSAAALACGMCLGAIASQTGGSTTRPAAYCGIPSCKPSFGRVSRAGLVPLAASMDHPGPMARSVADLALLLQVIAGEDDKDPQTLVPGNSRRNLVVMPAAAAPPRLGRVRGLFHDLAAPAVRALMEQVETLFRKEGARIEEIALPAEFAEVLPRHRIVMAVEAAQFHELRLRRHPEDYLPKIRGLLEEGLVCPAPEYARTKEHQRFLQADARNWFANVDVLLTPATTSPAPDAATTGDPAFNSPWSYTGLPTVSVPAGKSPEGMPLSIQLVGRPFEERTLLAVAAWCEKVLAQPLVLPPVTTASAHVPALS